MRRKSDESFGIGMAFWDSCHKSAELEGMIGDGM